MPLMHSEDLSDHDLLAQRQEWMLSALDEGHPFYSFIQSQVGYAAHHRNIIAKFQRFPQRNDILGRTSTAEEMQFIKDHNLMDLITGKSESSQNDQ